MNYNTMTAQQCADWLAERDGAWFSMDREIGPIGWCDKDGKLIGDHPYPLTLDAAAAALREGWRVDYIRDRGQYAELGNARWFARVLLSPGELSDSVCCEGPDELTARYRAAVAARMEDDK